MTEQPSATSRYEDVLARAVAALPLDADERLATYDRARVTLTSRLRSISPPLPEAAIEAERAALEVAIQRVEVRFAVSHAEPEAAEPPPAIHRLGRRRPYALVAVVCCVGIVLALLAGIYAFQHRHDIEKAAYQELRQTMVRPDAKVASNPDTHTASSAAMPYIFMRQLVHYRSTNPPGTVVIDKAQRYLYVILANVTAVRYGIALGGNCVEAAGRYLVLRKLGPSGEAQSQPALAPGPASGNRALYLDSDIHLIHGTNLPTSIGHAVSLGCFQLIQNDLAELYGRVPVGTRVVVN